LSLNTRTQLLWLSVLEQTFLQIFDSSSFRSVFHINSEAEKTYLLHNHAAIFKFIPESKTKFELEDEIKNVITNGEFISMEHLLERSTFKKGIIGLSYVQEIV